MDAWHLPGGHRNRSARVELWNTNPILITVVLTTSSTTPKLSLLSVREQSSFMQKNGKHLWNHHILKYSFCYYSLIPGILQFTCVYNIALPHFELHFFLELAYYFISEFFWHRCYCYSIRSHKAELLHVKFSLCLKVYFTSAYLHLLCKCILVFTTAFLSLFPTLCFY